MNEDNLMHDTSDQRAVSIYGRDDGIEDFPVLKAFQQYIDAEQEKARKRVLSLGIFFGVVLVVVITVFMILLHGINTRNQLLSDRLVEYAMNNSQRQPAVQTSSGNAQNETALKAMTDTLVTLQKQMQESRREPVSASVTTDRQTRAEEEKILRAKALLNEEKQRLAAEKERLHQIEIEQQRRKLYPELYQEDGQKYVPYNSVRKPQRTRTLTDDDIREIIREAYPEAEAKASSAKSTTQTSNEKANAADAKSDNDEDAVEYFKDDDYTIPIDVKGKPSKVQFTVPVAD